MPSLLSLFTAIALFFTSLFSSHTVSQVATTTVDTALPSYMLLSLRLEANPTITTPHSYSTLTPTGGLSPYRFNIQGEGALYSNALDTSYYYKAGNKEGKAVITVIDSNGAQASTTITVVKNLTVLNTRISLTPGQTTSLAPLSGKAPFTYSLIEGKGSITPSGIYTAPSTGTTARVQVRDAVGQTRIVEIVTTVASLYIPPPTIPLTTTPIPYTPVPATPIAGLCGTANGSSRNTLPTDNLCSKGQVTQVTGTGPWAWQCLGVSGGTSASCSASRILVTPPTPPNPTIPPVYGVCGSSNGVSFTSSPTRNLCATGTATPLSGTGPWAWQCLGASGGTSASCSASLSPSPLQGVCGTANNSSFLNTPSNNLCSVGAPSPVTGATSTWSWSCSGVNGGGAAMCGAVRTVVPVVGICGISDGAPLQSIPTSNLCLTGTPSSITGTGPWMWSCLGSGGGATNSCQTVASAPPLSNGDIYVDSISGSDTNSGTQDKPIKTLAKVKTLTVKGGNSLFLKCGSIWREQLTITSTFNPTGNISIKGYGNCLGDSYPIIRGSDIVSAWSKDTSTSNPIYVAGVNQVPLQVFINERKMIPARYPNFQGIGNEYNLLSQVPSQNMLGVSSADISYLSGKDLLGANMYVRVEPWTIDKKTVINYSPSNGLVTLHQPVAFGAEVGGGYVFENKKWMLDSPGEWYYDDIAKKLYIWPYDSQSPASQVVEVSVRRNALVISGARGIRIDHVSFEQASDIGLYVNDSADITMNDIKASYNKVENVALVSNINTHITNSFFSDTELRGVNISAGNNNSISNSLVKNIGIAGSPENSYSGIEIDNENGRIENNSIENSAYAGIRFANKSGTVIRGNTIKNICMRLADCAGIYTWNGNNLNNPSAGALIEKNAIITSNQNTEGTTPSLGAGIYLDNYTVRVSVLNNMISDTTTGIFLHEASNNIVSGNKVWKSSDESFSAAGNQGTIRNNTVTGNVFFAASYIDTAQIQGKVYHYAQKWSSSDLIDATTQDVRTNTIVNNKILTFSDMDTPTINFANLVQKTVTEWNMEGASDIHVSPFVAKEIISNTSGDSLVVDGQMNASSSWSTYFSNNALGSLSFDSYTGCTGMCAKFIAGNADDLLMSNTFPLERNQYYRLRYTMLGDAAISGAAVIRKPTPNYDTFGYAKRYNRISNGLPVLIDDVFMATTNEMGRLDFYGTPNQVLYYDTVSIYKANNVQFFDPYRHSSHLINSTLFPRSFSCADARLTTCEAVDDAGNQVVWPVTLPPQTSKIILDKDSMWR